MRLIYSEFSDVVQSDTCINCGVCAYKCPNQIGMVKSRQGFWQPQLKQGELLRKDQLKLLNEICPQSKYSKNEDIIAAEKFGHSLQKDKFIGHYSGLYAGYVADDSSRLRSSSGGLVSWLVERLLREGVADYAITVSNRPKEAPTHKNRDQLFEYVSIESGIGNQKAPKTRYHHVDFSKALKLISDTPGRYVLVALPCQAKVIELLKRNDPLFRERVVVVAAIVCGHMKSSLFSDYLSTYTAQARYDDIEGIDFRSKIATLPAYRYGVTVETKKGRSEQVADQIFGSSWRNNFFRMPGCFFCDDIFGEVADVTFGDAWLSRYAKDWKGTNVCVVRDDRIHRILLEGRDQKDIYLEPLTTLDVKESQDGGIRDRSTYLQHRLFIEVKQKGLAPKKRVSPRRLLRSKLAKRVELSWALAKKSTEAWLSASGNKRLFEERLENDVVALEELARVSNFRLKMRALLRNIRSPRQLLGKLTKLRGQ